MANANTDSRDLLVIVIVLGCVVAILLLSLAVTCACLCRYRLSEKKSKVAKGQIKKKPLTTTTTTTGQTIDDDRPSGAKDATLKPICAYFYHKPDAESQQMVTRIKIDDSSNQFGTSATNLPTSTGYQPALPWPRIGVSGAVAASNCARWNPAHEGRVVLNATSWNAHQGGSAVPVCVGGESPCSEFRPSQAERIVLNAVPGSYSQGEITRGNILYPVLS